MWRRLTRVAAPLSRARAAAARRGWRGVASVAVNAAAVPRLTAASAPKAAAKPAAAAATAAGPDAGATGHLDHRVLGKSQGLFMFHPYSAGSAFFLPHGTRIYNTIIDFLRVEYRKRGYDEVRSPLIYDKNLWLTSGHWENYKENMFIIESDKAHAPAVAAPTAAAAAAAAPPNTAAAAPAAKPGADAAAAGGDAHHSCAHYTHEALAEANASGTFALKAMNCPGHCLMFASRLHSYRDLPVRWADFSSLHRNEVTGSLTGLTRVRRFNQDDAHIFCRFDQIGQEIGGCLEFVRDVYGIFGFRFRARLSTRPPKFLGEVKEWDAAERILSERLTHFVQSAGPAAGGKWELNPGDGAFYGPKIDIVLTDAHGREHQCATIQLDFQLPQRFDLTYKAEDGSAQRPVMIHRAILGSMERMLAVLIEHTAGKWPLWLSPRQVMVCTVSSDKHTAYARAVQQRLRAWNERAYVDVDDSNESISKKIRSAQVAGYNLILVVGDAELKDGTVSVRARDSKKLEAMPLDAFIKHMESQIAAKK